MVIPLYEFFKRNVALPDVQKFWELPDADGRVIVGDGEVYVFQVKGYLVVEILTDSLHLVLFGLNEADGRDDLATGPGIVHLK